MSELTDLAKRIADFIFNNRDEYLVGVDENFEIVSSKEELLSLDIDFLKTKEDYYLAKKEAESLLSEPEVFRYAQLLDLIEDYEENLKEY